MAELKLYAADIICLQEVEMDQFYNFFLPELQPEGYHVSFVEKRPGGQSAEIKTITGYGMCSSFQGIFAPKSRAKTMIESERKYVDGCAIFFRTAKFKLMKEHLVEFNQLAMLNSEGSDDMLNRVMTKGMSRIY